MRSIGAPGRNGSEVNEESSTAWDEGSLKFWWEKDTNHLPESIHIRAMEVCVLHYCLHTCVLHACVCVFFVVTSKIPNQLSSIGNCVLGCVGATPLHLEQQHHKNNTLSDQLIDFIVLLCTKVLTNSPPARFHFAWSLSGKCLGWEGSTFGSWHCWNQQTHQRLLPGTLECKVNNKIWFNIIKGCFLKCPPFQDLLQSWQCFLRPSSEPALGLLAQHSLEPGTFSRQNWF